MARVLLLESDPTVAQTLTQLLASLGHDVTCRATPHDAALVAFLEPLDIVYTSASYGMLELTQLHEIARRRSPRVECVLHGAQVVEAERPVWATTGASRVLSTFTLVEELLERYGVGTIGRASAALH
jgi:CheY-like chemotaxis protein